MIHPPPPAHPRSSRSSPSPPPSSSSSSSSPSSSIYPNLTYHPIFRLTTRSIPPITILILLLLASLINPSLASPDHYTSHLQPLAIPSEDLLPPPTIPSTAPLPLNTAFIKSPRPNSGYPNRSTDLDPYHPTDPQPPLPQPTQPPTPLSPDQQLLILQRRQLNWTTVVTVIGPPGSGAQTPHNDSSSNTAIATAQPTPTSSQPPVVASTSSSPVTDQNTPDHSLPADRPCYPGEESQRYPGRLSPTRPTQTSTLLVIGLYFFIILVCWNLFLVRYLILPLKLVVVAWHELGHLIVAIFAGAEIEELVLDPNAGGTIRLQNPISPVALLPAGYLSSCLFGGLMIFCGFNTLASKIASIFVGMSLIGTGWWANSLIHKILLLGAIATLIALWFVDHAGLLRYYVLLMGVLSSWYVLYDVMDDFVFRKLNPCCPILFEERWPRITAGQWTLIWIFYSALNFTAWILLSLAVWRQTPRGMFCQSQQFLPT